MKKIALASAAMGGAALIAFGASGTFAALSDSSTQTLSAGAGTLTVGIDRPATLPVEAGNLAPGESTTVPFFVKNTGTDLSGKVGVALGAATDRENSCSSVSERTSEWGACDTENDKGEFSKFATYKVAVSSASSAATCVTGAPVIGQAYPFTLTDGIAPSASPITLAPGQGRCVLVTITLPTGADNTVQGDSMSFDAVVTLEQA